jgi:hypothetical protein
MTPMHKLANSDDHRLRMVAVHHMWALWFRRQRDDRNMDMQFHAAHELLGEARERRLLRTGR